jgi:hypothetical protein
VVAGVAAAAHGLPPHLRGGKPGDKHVRKQLPPRAVWP